MTDFLLCETCETLVSTSITECPCCRSHFQQFPYTASLIAFCRSLDDGHNHMSIENRLRMIQTSIFQYHPVIRYRRARLLILQTLSKPETLNKVTFFNLIKAAVAASVYGPQYWEELVSLLNTLLPSPFFDITAEEMHDIISLTRSSFRVQDEQFAYKLAMQVSA